ncbi:MAG: iron-containing redox enzyme family protein [Acidobacteriota bacterium]|nr:iron-containing redox enzyme family protein [Acidobacteriota bacterium]
MKADTDLAATLLAVARRGPMETNPFVQAVVRGEISREEIKNFAIFLTTVAAVFPKRIAAVLAICDDAEVKRSLLGNLLEEEGVVAYVPGEGVRIDYERAHTSLARRFARAAGASEVEIDAHTVPPVRWFEERIRMGDWMGAFAHFSIGYEANVPATFRLLMEPLLTIYGFREHDLEFLTEHFIADERHGIEAADLIERVAVSGEARARALEGARRGGHAWWHILRAHLRPAAAPA